MYKDIVIYSSLHAHSLARSLARSTTCKCILIDSKVGNQSQLYYYICCSCCCCCSCCYCYCCLWCCCWRVAFIKHWMNSRQARSQLMNKFQFHVRTMKMFPFLFGWCNFATTSKISKIDWIEFGELSNSMLFTQYILKLWIFFYLDWS